MTIPDLTPVTPPQLAMLMHGDEDPESAVYGIANLLRVDEEVSVETIADAWRTVIAEFSALRSSFTLDSQDSWAITTAHAATDIPIRICRCSGNAVDEHLDECRQNAAGEAADRNRPIKVEVHVADRPHVIFAYHHALLDGWSAATIISRSLAHMRHLAGLGDSPVPVADVMPAAQKRLLAASRSTDANAFWHKVIREMPQTLIGQRTDGPPDHRELVEEIDRDLWGNLVAVARRLGVTVPTLVMAAYASAVSTALRQSGVAFGLVTSLRGIVEGIEEEAIGLFLNTLPYAIELSAADDWAQLAATVRRKAAEASQHSAVDVASLSSVTHQPVSQLMDTALAFQTYPGAKGRFSDPSASDDRRGIVTVRVQDHTHYALTACVYPADDGRWAVRMSFDAARVAPSLVEELSKNLLLGLRDITEDPSRPIMCASPVDAAADSQAQPSTHAVDDDVTQIASSQTITAVAAAWKDLLGREFDPSDDFFLSGGSSMTAMRLAMRLQSTLGMRVPVRAIFESRTGLEIVRYIEKVTTGPGRE
ncbi:condensation domain-containing protein [Streptomyces sp. NPDC004546]|uniref:condensation domain-containing protein n=1 Tax=Streptomyces sp. NPDC004546 TaxID=3154282 RepID=UPI0033A7A3E1